MSKLMHEYVVRECIVDGHRAVQVENATTAIGAAVHENFDEFVRSKLRYFAQPVVVESEDVTLGSKRIVGRNRIAINSCGRPRDSGLVRRRTKTPDIEVAAMLFERRGREQNRDQASGVGLKFSDFARSVTIAQQQQINFRGRITHPLNWNLRGWRARFRPVDENIFR